jgi:hypothetical protein
MFNEEDLPGKRSIPWPWSLTAARQAAPSQITGGNFENVASKTEPGLVLKGLEHPTGYTEPLLHAWRLNVKANASLTPLSS